jgi:formylglycine-generating enzyme required for sulfatase activity
MKKHVVMLIIVAAGIAAQARAGQATGTAIYIPAAARNAGLGCTTWRTDLQVKTRGTQQATYQIDLLQHNQDNSSPASVTFTLDPGVSIRYKDALQDLFAFSGSAALRITATSGDVMVTSRTYNDGASGTYGVYVAGYEESEAFGEGEHAALIQLSMSVDPEEGYRSNVGFLNVTGQSIDVELSLYLSTGVHLGTLDYALRPYEYDQVTNIFDKVSTTNVEDGYALVRTTTSGGEFFTCASVIDNRSGDAIYIPGQPEQAPPNQAGCNAFEETTFMLPGGVPLEMVCIPAGTFMMGAYGGERGSTDAEHPQHQVTLTRDFWIGTYELTQAQWEAVTGSNPASDYGVGDDYPVYDVSWDDVCGGTTGSDCAAASYIGRLNQALGTTAFRLPTEAEWEYAARGGTTTRFSHGDALDCDDWCDFCENHDRYMVWCGNTNGPSEPVGSKDPNPFGLHDMHGNLFEWVSDWVGYYDASPQQDPTGPESGSFRVTRGGSWLYQAQEARSANRKTWGSLYPSAAFIGFRLARSPGP